MGPMDVGAPGDPSPESSEAVWDEVQSASRSPSSPAGLLLLPAPPVSGGEEAPARWGPQDAPSDRSGERFLRKRINCLQGKGTNSRGCPPEPQPPTAVTPEATPVPDEQMHALQAFCTSKINLLQHRQAPPKGRKRGRLQKLPPRWDAEASEGEAGQGPAPEELLDRLRLHNVAATLHQAAAVKPQHAPARCPACRRKRAELAQAAFLQRKKTLLESLLLREKIEERLHTTDFLTFMGEAHRGLPRLSDDPRIIWKRLNERSRERGPGLERSGPEQRM